LWAAVQVRQEVVQAQSFGVVLIQELLALLLKAELVCLKAQKYQKTVLLVQVLQNLPIEDNYAIPQKIGYQPVVLRRHTFGLV